MFLVRNNVNLTCWPNETFQLVRTKIQPDITTNVHVLSKTLGIRRTRRFFRGMRETFTPTGKNQLHRILPIAPAISRDKRYVPFKKIQHEEPSRTIAEFIRRAAHIYLQPFAISVHSCILTHSHIVLKRQICDYGRGFVFHCENWSIPLIMNQRPKISFLIRFSVCSIRPPNLPFLVS